MNRTWRLMIFAALLLAGTSDASFAAIPSQSDPSRLLNEAVQFQRAGDFHSAILRYQEFLRQYPDFADVQSNLGAAYVAVGDYAKAIEHYQKALALGNGSDPVAIRHNLAIAYYKAAQFDNTIETLEAVLAAKPDHAPASLLLADCYLRRGDSRRVVGLLTPFEQSGSSDPGLFYLLGTALIWEGELDRGELLVDRILREGDSAEAHLMLGTAHLKVGDVPGAISEFKKAVELNPALPSANAFLGKALRETGSVAEAIPYFERELEVNPYDYDSNLYLGVALYRREQKYEQALKHFEQALRVRPGDLAALFQVASVYMTQNRTEEALGIVESVVEEAPDFLEGHITLTRLYYKLKRRDDAERHRQIVERLRAEKDASTLKKIPGVDDPD